MKLITKHSLEKIKYFEKLINDLIYALQTFELNDILLNLDNSDKRKQISKKYNNLLKSLDINLQEDIIPNDDPTQNLLLTNTDVFKNLKDMIKDNIVISNNFPSKLMLIGSGSDTSNFTDNEINKYIELLWSNNSHDIKNSWWEAEQDLSYSFYEYINNNKMDIAESCQIELVSYNNPFKTKH